MKNEILSSCCAFGGSCEEVHVLRSDCPIDRELGRREVEDNHGEKSEECTCIYRSNFGGGVSRCEFYNGIKQVTRSKRKEYKVLCSKIQSN